MVWIGKKGGMQLIEGISIKLSVLAIITKIPVVPENLLHKLNSNCLAGCLEKCGIAEDMNMPVCGPCQTYLQL